MRVITIKTREMAMALWNGLMEVSTLDNGEKEFSKA